jgi:hypothetical protein
MKKEIFYKKVGRRYVPVYEYDEDLLSAMPKGTHLVMVHPGGKSTVYNIDPNYAALIAASRTAKDKMTSALVDASTVRRETRENVPLTWEQKEAWDNLVKVFGDSARMLHWASAYDIASEGIKAIEDEAEQLLRNPALRDIWEQFLLVAKLTKEKANDSNS